MSELTQAQLQWVEKIRIMCGDVIQGKIPTYEDFVNDLEKAIETCPEP